MHLYPPILIIVLPHGILTSESGTIKIEKVHKAALCVVYNEYTTS